MDSFLGMLDCTAATGVPSAINTDDLATLGLLDADWLQPTPELVDLATNHGCVVSGSYAGPPGHDSYYLFVPAKAA